jgi:uncharacterized OB-fold protein
MSTVGYIEPDITPDSAEWWKALDEGRLLALRCGSCGRTTFPPVPTCSGCGSADVGLVEVGGTGTVYSWVRIHRALDPSFTEDVPYTIVTVDLTEGPRMFGRLLAEDVGDLIGRSVRAEVYRPVDGPALGFVLTDRFSRAKERAVELKVGGRVRSAVDTTQVIVVKAGASDIDLQCGGEPVVEVNAEVTPRPADSFDGEGTLMGKRYTDEETGLELLCTKPGPGTLSVGTRALLRADAKALPSSD